VLMGRLHDTPTWRSVLGVPRAADRELAFAALERVGIVEKAYTRASELSGGQQQRVAIARVIAQQAGVVLADEPVASLDPPTANQVLRDLKRIGGELGHTTVVNLHFLDMARRYADRIIGMRAGAVVFDGSAEQADDAVFEEIYGRSLTADDVLLR
jgi:phosphonate transport system ATP-binding protein